MFLKQIQTFHQDAVVLGKNFGNLSGFTSILTGNYFNFVSFFYFHTTSSAKEIILSKPLSLSSRGIGPKILPPRGSLPSTITTALSLNLMEVPSFLLYSFLCLTITALATSFFLTVFLGSASFTETTIISPTWAYRRLVPPKTLIHWTNLAPLLSATFNIE